mgnify:CR=1 FL=1
MSKRRIFFVVNQRLTYISTQLLLEWSGVSSERTLYCSYHDVENKLDEFLMEYADFGDLVFLIGFSESLSNELVGIYKKYSFKVLKSDINNGSNIYFETLKKLAPKMYSTLSNKQKYYINCVKSLIKNEFSNKDAYIMGIIFYKITPQKFYEQYKRGFVESKKNNVFVIKHLKLFNKQDHTVYHFNGYYFVLSSVKYMGDYIYKFHKKYDNLSIVDLDAGRVYMKNLKNTGKDINNLCKSYCTNIRGFTDFCSGDITEDFLKLTKKMEKFK